MTKLGPALPWPPNDDLVQVRDMAYSSHTNDVPAVFAAGIAEASRHIEDFQRNGTVKCIAAAAAAWNSIVCSDRFGTAPAPFRANVLDSLATSYHRRYLLTGDQKQAQLALIAWKLAIDATLPGTVQHRRIANNAGLSESHCYARDFDRARLDVSISLLTLACDSGGPIDADLADSLRNLSVSLYERFSATGQIGDLDQAIARLRLALPILTQHDPMAAELLTNLGVYLLKRFPSAQDSKLLSQAVESQRRAFDLARNPERRASIANNLAEALVALYEHGVGDGPLDEALRLLRATLRRDDLSARLSQQTAVNLSMALIRSYFRSGDEQTLNEIIELLDRSDNRSHASVKACADLGRALSEAYHRMGKLELLDKAIYTLRLAAGNASAQDPLSAAVAHSLAIVLHDRFRRLGRPEDLADSLKNIERAVSMADSSGSTYSELLCSSAHILRSVYDSSKEEGVQLALLATVQRAVEVSLSEPPAQQSAAKSAMAAILHSVWATGGRDELLRQAIELLESSLRNARGTRIFTVRASIAHFRHDLQKAHPSEQTELGVIEAYRAAAEIGLPGHPAGMLALAIDWGAWAMNRESWDEAIEASIHATQAADQLLDGQSNRDAHAYWVQECTETYEALAYCLAKTGDLRGAVMAVERGRSRALAQLLCPDGDATTTGIRAPVVPSLSFEEISGTIEPGSGLVYFITIPQGALVLTVIPATNSNPEIQVRWFCNYNANTSNSLLVGVDHHGWLSAYLQWRRAGSRDDELGSVHDALDRSLGVLAKIGFSQVSEDLITKGITLAIFSPSPVLGVLPLHAIRSKAGTAMIDSLAISYTPCAASLIRRTQDILIEEHAALVVVEDGAPGAMSLPFAVLEADLLAECFPNCKRFNRSSTRVAELCSEMPNADIWHFACHGLANHETPLLSSLSVAAEGELTLQAIFSLPPVSPRLVVLAGCETALTSLGALQSGMSLSSGFLMQGCQAVIATLWAMPDWCLALLMSRFYDRWSRATADPATSLREAQLWLRDTSWDEKLIQLRNSPRSQAKTALAEALDQLPAKPDTTNPFYWAGCRLLGH